MDILCKDFLFPRLIRFKSGILFNEPNEFLVTNRFWILLIMQLVKEFLLVLETLSKIFQFYLKVNVRFNTLIVAYNSENLELSKLSVN